MKIRLNLNKKSLAEKKALPKTNFSFKIVNSQYKRDVDPALEKQDSSGEDSHHASSDDESIIAGGGSDAEDDAASLEENAIMEGEPIALASDDDSVVAKGDSDAENDAASLEEDAIMEGEAITLSSDDESSSEEEPKRSKRLSRKEAREAANRDCARLTAMIPDKYHEKAKKSTKHKAVKLRLMIATYYYIIDLKKKHKIPLHGYVVQHLSDLTTEGKPSSDASYTRRSERRYYHMLRNALPIVYRERMDDMEAPEIQDKALIPSLEFIIDMESGNVARPVLYD